jgi:predicted nucleic acid-binding protein
MSFLLDTNIVSETLRARPEPRVMSWLETAGNNSIHVSVLTLGEVRRGIELLEHGPRRERFRVWLEATMPEWLGEHVLPVTAAVADRWGRLRAASPKTLPIVDSLIAATALHHDLRLVTRNERDFAKFPGLVVVNPWRF